MTEDVWLKDHPYLQPVAKLHAQVNAAVAGISPADPVVSWEGYRTDFLEGLPLLRSSHATIDSVPVAKIIVSLVENLASSSLPGEIAEQIRTLRLELHSDPNAPEHVVSWLLDHDTFTSKYPGLLRYLGWTALARYLRPVTDTFANWREEERWLRSYCPTCGSPPAMAQLVGRDPGRRRLLSCGRCGARWQYRRTHCPFCENEDDHRLAVITVDGEGGLRIDHCESCQAYLKTYDGEGSETVLLADWTSVHLDVLACDRGLRRVAGSLYDL